MKKHIINLLALKKYVSLPIVIFTIFLSTILVAQEDFSNDKNIPEKPNPPKLVNDFANFFTEENRRALETKLVAYDDSTSTQIAVVTVETLNGYAEDDFALRLGRKWGIGQKGKNNGILILLAKEERAVSIELGYGVENYITDSEAKRIIDNVMVPQFKQGNFYAGVDAATNDIIAMLEGTFQKGSNTPSSNDPSIGFVLSIMFIIVVVILILSSFTKGGGSGGSYTGSSGGWKSSSSSWSSSSSSSSSSGGGFGGFGGGSFGGGGASGKW